MDRDRGPFSAGSAVLVVALNRRGEVVESRGRGYRVTVGGLTITCRADELRPVSAPAGGRRKGHRTRTIGSAASRAAASVPHGDAAERGGTPTRSSLDLHGLTTGEAREALLRHLDAALRAGHATVEVVHGIGTGRVRAAVLEVLSRVPSVRSVRPHPTNRGMTLVDL